MIEQTGKTLRRQQPFLLILAVGGLLPVCACGPGFETGGPAPTGEELEVAAQQALSATMPGNPVQINFDFRLKEADLRFAGRGVARVEPPYRLRIDLFSNRGEGLFRAALVESDLRIPPGVPIELAPPPALLWAALGVFRPDAELQLLDGRSGGGGSLTLRYGSAAEENLLFRLSQGLLTRAEIREDGHLTEEVDLELDEGSERVVETVYRNHPMFVELTFSLKSVENVESFPADIWFPEGWGRAR